jgi:putative endonuclease
MGGTTHASVVAAPAEGTVTVPSVAAFVYLLRCVDDTLYCGWTNDLDRRVAAHLAGTASRYTRSRLPVELIWSKPMATRSEAMREEVRIKRLSRGEKLRLAGTISAR